MTVDPRLLELLAHRPPMLLLDRVVALDLEAGQASAEVDIHSRCSFFSAPHGVPAWTGIEYMAQTVGLLAGVEGASEGTGAPQGYLLGTRKFQTSTPWFAAGVTLRVACAEAFVDDRGMGVYNCRISGPDCEATARLTLLKKPRA